MREQFASTRNQSRSNNLYGNQCNVSADAELANSLRDKLQLIHEDSCSWQRPGKYHGIAARNYPVFYRVAPEGPIQAARDFHACKIAESDESAS